MTSDEFRELADVLGLAYGWCFWRVDGPHVGDVVVLDQHSVVFDGQAPRVGDVIDAGRALQVRVESAGFDGSHWTVTLETG